MQRMFAGWYNELADSYGGKGGWVKSLCFQFVYRMGGLRSYKDIDWQRINRLVFVCKGNVCRSPYAEAKAHSFGINAISFGLESKGGKPADATALESARQRAISLHKHRARSISHVVISGDDLLIAMEPYQAKTLRELSKHTAAQVTLLGLANRDPQPHIQDPLGRSDTYFQVCFASIDTAIEAMISSMRSSRHASKVANTR